MTEIERPRDAQTGSDLDGASADDELAVAVRLGWHAGQLEVASMSGDERGRPVCELLAASLPPLLYALGLVGDTDLAAKPTAAATAEAVLAADRRLVAAFGIGRTFGCLRMLASSDAPPAQRALRAWFKPERPDELAAMFAVVAPLLPIGDWDTTLDEFRAWSEFEHRATDAELSSRIGLLRADVRRWHEALGVAGRRPGTASAAISESTTDATDGVAMRSAMTGDTAVVVPTSDTLVDPQAPPEGGAVIKRPTDADPGVSERASKSEQRRGSDLVVDRKTRRRAARKQRRVRRGIVAGIWIVAAIVAVLVLRVTVISTFVIPTLSMSPTIEPGDRVLVNILPGARDHPGRGTLVVFHRPAADTAPPPGGLLLKRVIGLPGEVISGSGQSIYVNGAKLREPWLPPLTGICALTGGYHFAAVVVPKGSYFVMGDCRQDSLDSRSWGPVPQSSIVGQAFIVVWRSGHPWWKWL